MKTKSYKNIMIQEKIRQLYKYKYGDISGDEVLIYLTEEMNRGTNKLNWLTGTLIVLTIILTILTGISIWW